MARAIHKLTARAAEAISKDGRRRWTFMYTWRGKQREAGFGSAGPGGASLKEARDKAAEGRKLIRAGIDPIAEWNKPDAEEIPTFGQAADDYLASHASGFRNAKHRAQWEMTLTRYCEAIRKTPVDKVDTEAVLSVLKPLCARAPETASRLRGRIETVLDASKARGFIGHHVANPARWRGHLDKLLPKRGKLARGHHAAMPYADVPAFLAKLRERPAIAARALEFCILTATRSGRRWPLVGTNSISTRRCGRFRPGGRKRRASIASRCPIGRWLFSVRWMRPRPASMSFRV